MKSWKKIATNAGAAIFRDAFRATRHLFHSMNSLLALVGSTTIDRLQFGYSSMSESKRVVVTDIIDDDEFEEFESENWTPAKEDKEDPKLWAQNWDDEDLDPEFADHLRQEIEKQSTAT